MFEQGEILDASKTGPRFFQRSTHGKYLDHPYMEMLISCTFKRLNVVKGILYFLLLI